MKRIVISIISIMVLSSCMTDEKYEDYNRDPKNPTQVSANFLYNSAVKSLTDQMTSTNVNDNVFRLLGQYWTETTYTEESNYDLTGRNIPQRHWSEMYRDVLLDLTNAQQLVMEDESKSEGEKSAAFAQSEVLMIYTWQQMVDTFGNIPYTEALTDNKLPVYDDAATIYTDLINRLDAAIPNLTGSGFPGADVIYNGNGASWKAFANSLKLKMGLRIADVPSMQALSTSTVQSAVAAGVITSNAGNASFPYEGASPNTNPVWSSLVESGRADFVAANTIVDIMNTLEDPRRATYFRQNLGAGVYQGGIYGTTSNYFTNSQAADVMHDPTNPACLIDYAEVSFFLAEAAERSIVGTPADAEGHYNNAITASFDYWGAANVGDYLNNPAVAYTTASGDWREKIGTQFWLAMYNRGFEGWTAWRIYDAPQMNIPGDTENPVPFRYTYPVNEQNLNPTNWEAAAGAIGGDAQSTKIFWDVN